MAPRKKTGPAPLPVRDLSVQRPLSPVRATHVALVLAATTLLACGASHSGPVVIEPKDCPRLGGAVSIPPTATPLPTTSNTSATTPATASSNAPAITPIEPPMLGGAPPMYSPPDGAPR